MNSQFSASVLLFLSAVVLGLPSALHSQEDDHARHSHAADARALGRVSFPNSGNAAAQKGFIEGLALIHSFEYEQAHDAFERAIKADPNFALPYWMEALSKSQLIWGIDDTAAARSVLNRLGPTSDARLSRARTARERAFGAAVEAFYSSGTPQNRAKAFADSLRSWNRRMPGDAEAHAFAALGILWQALYEQKEAAAKLRIEASQHAQYVFDRNPLHPGAAHYIIHATDAPATAQRGLRAAVEYSRIAPDAEHALHMPSHIFLPLGMWDELVSANERAWKASRADAARQGMAPWASDFHSLNWLQYGYLQQGRWKAAKALIDTARVLTSGMSGKVKPAANPDAALAAEQLAFRYASETGDWSVFPADSAVIDITDPTISDRARSMGTTARYQRAVLALKARRDSSAVQQVMVDLSKTRPVSAQMLESDLFEARGDQSARLAALEKLRPLTRVDRYASMTPSPVINVHEALGAALLASGRAREAVNVYREALEDRPRRAASLLGLARAQEAMGDKIGAKATYAELSKMWVRADPEVKVQLRR